MDGRREFWSKKSQRWIECTNPPEVPCPKCGQWHWYHEAEALAVGPDYESMGGGALDEVDGGGSGTPRGRAAVP